MRKNTWRSVLDNFNKSSAMKCYADFSTIAEEFGVYEDPSDWEQFEKRVKKYYITSWICTDTRVGLAAYYFDGVLFAVSSQQCRKCNEDIYFISESEATKVREYIQSLITDQNTFSIIDYDQEISEGWFRQGD